MNTPGPTSSIKRVLASTALVVLCSAGLGTASATAAGGETCGWVKESSISKAFGLAETLQHNFLIKDVGNTAGVIHDRCRDFVWRGHQPGNAAQRREAILGGVGASMRMEAWVPDPGPFAGAWQMNFQDKLEGLQSRTRALFIEGPLHGSTFSPPRFGAEEAIGYQGTTKKTRKVRVFWWRPSTDVLFSATVVEARGKPAVASLMKVAAIVVPHIHIG